MRFDAMHLAVVSEKLLHLVLLHLELFCVWHVQVLASAAAVRNRAQTILLRCLFSLLLQTEVFLISKNRQIHASILIFCRSS